MEKILFLHLWKGLSRNAENKLPFLHPAFTSSRFMTSRVSTNPPRCTICGSSDHEDSACPSDELQERMIRDFLHRMRTGRINGSEEIAVETSQLLRSVISQGWNPKYDSLESLLASVKRVGRTLTESFPTVFVIGNIARRVLFSIREEIFHSVRPSESPTDETEPETDATSIPPTVEALTSVTIADSASEPDLSLPPDIDIRDDVYHKRSLVDLFTTTEEELSVEHADSLLTPAKRKEIKSEILHLISELILVVQGSRTHIARTCQNHVYHSEVVLTVGHSHTVLAFLRRAAEKKIRFRVLVTEHAPDLSGHRMVRELNALDAELSATATTPDSLSFSPMAVFADDDSVTSSASGDEHAIETILIPDSAIAAVMSRVNKVFVGTRSVMANGGLVAESGTHVVAIAAKRHNVPVVVCTALYKLTPQYPTQKHLVNRFNNPNQIMNRSSAVKNVHVINPEFDYVPPELVSLFITNDGVHNPMYIYRLLMEYYDPSDYKL